MGWLRNIAIRYKISLISLIGILGFLAFQVINYRLSVFTTEELREIESADFPVLEISNETYIHFMDMGRMYESAVAEGDIDTINQAKALSDIIISDLNQIKALSPSYENEISKLLDTFGYYSTAVHLNAMNFVQSENDVEALSDNEMFESLAHVRVLRERFDKEQRDFRLHLSKDFAQKLAQLQKQSEITVSQGFVLGVLLILALFIASFSIIRHITNALNNAVSIAYQVANGKLSSPIESKYNDETGLLIQSLVIMRDALKTQKEEGEQRQVNQRRVTELNETMRGDKSLEELGNGVLNYLAISFNALVGAFWILDNEKQRLQRVSGYALSELEKHQDYCELGQGLIGQAAQLAQVYHTNDVPVGYLSIESGLGSSQAGSLLIVPFQHEGEVAGVIELASFTPFQDNDIDFIERYNSGIAVAVNSSQSRLKMSTILKKTQLQAHELEQQSLALETKSEQLELSGRYKSQFLSTMSHELRTPLNSILILSKGLLENKQNNLLPKQQEHAKVIYAAGSDLLTLINDILDLSKVEEGKLDLIIDEIDALDFSRVIFHQFEYEAESKDLDFEVTVSDKLPQFFYADVHRLSQILRNFLSNALKFTEKGYVHLSLEPALLDPQSPGSEPAIAFVVTDSGIGINQDKHDHIFEAFRQADGTTSRQFGGTGLGLTISRELSELMRGYITVSSKGEGQGSTFTLVLPIDNRQSDSAHHSDGSIIPARTSEVSKNSPSKNGPSENSQIDHQLASVKDKSEQSLAKTHRILLVEDDLLQVESIQTICMDQNLILDTATTAKDARSCLDQQSYDCLILDLHLPDGNSIGLLRELRNKEAQSDSSQSRHLFTIVYTAETVNRDTESELQAIADRIIIKTQRSLEWLSHEIRQFFMFEFGDKSEANLIAQSSNTENVQNNTANAATSIQPEETLVAEKQDADEQVLDATALKGKSVLIVDDDIRNIYSLSAAFEDFEMIIHTAQNGEEALEFLVEHIDNDQVDIVLMDVMMPVLNGLEATKRIREVPELESIPIISLTAKVMEDDKQDCLSAGSNAYISKPVDIPELQKQLLGFIG